MREEPVVYINGSPFVLREEVWRRKQIQASISEHIFCHTMPMASVFLCPSIHTPPPLARSSPQVRPLKNMMEYAGIEAARIEAMEERLKKDVLAEVCPPASHLRTALPPI